MSPKYITCHHYRAGQTLIEPHDEFLLNPRRVDRFEPVKPPTQQPGLYCGTKVYLGSNKHVVIRETLEDIRRLLKK